MTAADTSLPTSPAPPFGSVPAAAVVAACLRVQGDVSPRGRLARFFGRSPLSDESRPWFVGALGELDVAERLERLGEEWSVLHAVPIGDRGSDIDHVVVGPGGVFTVNTKFHEGAKVWVGSRRLLVNGQKTDHLRNARYEAGRVSRLLSAALDFEAVATPILTIVGSGQWTVREQPDDVVVLRETELARWLSRRKPVLAGAELENVSAVVRDRATWTLTEGFASDDVDRFARLRSEVRGAKCVRLAWASGAAIGLLGAMWLLLSNLTEIYLLLTGM